MKKLTIGSFKRHGGQGSFQHYFEHITEDNKAVCLEACMGGYCVAVYKIEGDQHTIIGEKTCTNIEGYADAQIFSGFSVMNGDALFMAVDIANKKLGL
jgi:hypothetical protein